MMSFSHLMSHSCTSHLFSFSAIVMHHKNSKQAQQSFQLLQCLSRHFNLFFFCYFFSFVDFFLSLLGVNKQRKSCTTATRWFGTVVYVQPALSLKVETLWLKQLRGSTVLKFQPPGFTPEPPPVETHLMRRATTEHSR